MHERAKLLINTLLEFQRKSIYKYTSIQIQSSSSFICPLQMSVRHLVLLMSIRRTVDEAYHTLYGGGMVGTIPTCDLPSPFYKNSAATVL